MHRYCIEVFRDGADYAEHAGRSGTIECEDVHLALKLKSAATQTAPETFLIRLARERNRQPLPAPHSGAGVQLPRPKDCLLTPNYQLEPRKLWVEEAAQKTEARDVTEALVPPVAKRRARGKLNICLHSTQGSTVAAGTASSPRQHSASQSGAANDMDTEIDAAFNEAFDE